MVNEVNGDVLLVHPNGYQWRSSDHGVTWRRQPVKILPDAFGLGSPEGVPLIVWASQAGVTLHNGPQPGRLLVPGRILGPRNSNDEPWRPYHYNTAIYSNLDTDRGQMPQLVGGTIENDRERITVWASFGGAKTWPIKRLVFDGPSAYSNLGVGRPGTTSEGRIFLLYEGGPGGMYEGVHLAVFNLSWLLDGLDPERLLPRANQ